MKVLVPVPETVVAMILIMLPVTDEIPEMVRAPVSAPGLGDRCGVVTELDVCSGRSTCARADPVDGAGPSPATGVALTLSVMSVADARGT